MGALPIVPPAESFGLVSKPMFRDKQTVDVWNRLAWLVVDVHVVDEWHQLHMKLVKR